MNNLNLHAGEATSEIQVDGNLDEEAWQYAAVEDSFHQVEPVEYAEPSERTTVRILYDHKYLYIGIEAFQSENHPIVAKQLIQERSIDGDDQLVIILDPLSSSKTGYSFSLNPNAIREEALIQNTSDLDRDWDPIWYAVVQKSEKRWVSEMAIPFNALSFPSQGENWGINIYRIIAAANETVAISSIDHRIDLAAAVPLVGISGVDSGTGLKVVAGGFAKYYENDDENYSDNSVEPTLDLFYKWTNTVDAALTFNTDFSAAEVDQRELNLTRFDLFFPEKRDFFLQNTNLFDFGGIDGNARPYYSRKIGLGEEGEPLDINVGAKISGFAGRFSFGLLAVQQEAEINPENTEVYVGRAQAMFNERHAGGFIFTEGNPISGLSDSLAGFDYRYFNNEMFGDQEFQSFFWWQKSDSEEAGDDDEAYGFQLLWPNDLLDAAFSVKDIGIDFRPPVGFVNRVGVRDFLFESTLRYRPEGSLIWIADFGFEANWVDDSAGKLETRFLEFKPVDLRNYAGDQFEAGLSDHYERLVEPFELTDDILILPGEYEFQRYLLEYSSADFRSFVTELELSWGDFYNGELIEAVASFTYSPNAHLQLGLDLERNRLKFNKATTDLDLIRFSMGIAFSHQWSWTNLLQYDSESRELGINSRLRWIPAPGKETYLVLNHGRFLDELDRFQSVETELTLKFSYSWLF